MQEHIHVFSEITRIDIDEKDSIEYVRICKICGFKETVAYGKRGNALPPGGALPDPPPALPPKPYDKDEGKRKKRLIITAISVTVSLSVLIIYLLFVLWSLDRPQTVFTNESLVFETAPAADDRFETALFTSEAEDVSKEISPRAKTETGTETEKETDIETKKETEKGTIKETENGETETVTEPVTYPLTEKQAESVTEPLTEKQAEPVTKPVTEFGPEPVTEYEPESAAESTMPPCRESPAAPSSAMQETSPTVIDLPLAGMIYTGEEIYGFTGQEIVLNIIVDPGRTYRFEGNKKPEEGLWPASDSYICEIDETDGSYRFIRF
ncbi:MAG: hypothetical protein IKO30_02990 [Lachnospiraceae bacterium]|nr:hypothetical protein [Lachnospiraceae bacterium]